MKKTIRDNYRLDLTPDTFRVRASTLTNHVAMRELLADIERAVRRHVDGVDGIVQRWDTREECSHCGLRWEVLAADEVAEFGQDEHSVEGEPVCCMAAIVEFRAERGIPPLAEMGGA